MTEALSVDRVEELRAELLPGCRPVRAVTRFAAGSISGAHRVDLTGGEPLVLKVFRPQDLNFAGQEARALSFLTGHGVGVSPRMLAFSRSAAALGGRACLVLELRPGRTLTELHGELTGAQWHELYRQLGAVLRRLHDVPAAGYGGVGGAGRIGDGRPDNAAHTARLVERELPAFRAHGGDPALAARLAEHLVEHAAAFADCPHPAYCHGDVHEENLLADNENGDWRLTGLLDPANLHAADPLVDLVRLDEFSMHGDPAKLTGLLTGYGVPAPPGEWPRAWLPRLRLYRILLAVELYNWFGGCGETHHLPRLARTLRAAVA